MTLEQFEIILDNPTSTYQPGELVTGKVLVKAKSSEVKAKGLIITFKGHAAFSLGSNSEAGVKIRGNELYFNLGKKLFGSILKEAAGDEETEANSKVFPPGVLSSFPFSFEIPADKHIPSSAKFPDGEISYVLVAVLHRTFWKNDDETWKSIHVKAGLHLADVDDAAHPVQNQEIRRFCCWCCVSGDLSLTVKLPKGGYIPGEKIMAEVEIVNKCGRHINNFLAAICQRLEYRSNGGVREKLNLFCEVSRGKGLDNGQSETWNVELVVPDLPPTKLGGTCSIIVVEYAVVVWSAPKTWSDSLINFCPIVIGSEGEAVPTIAKSLI